MSQPLPPLRVLFLCTGNSARSQIAEALLQHKGKGRYEVASAGVSPAAEVHPLAVTSLLAAGIDWSGRRPKSLEAVSDQSWDVIITTCDKSRESCPRFGSQPVYAHWSVPDPAAVSPSELERAFEDTVRTLTRRISLMLTVRLDQIDRQELQAALRVTETGSHEVLRSS